MGLGLAEGWLSTHARAAVLSPALPKQWHSAPWMQACRGSLSSPPSRTCGAAPGGQLTAWVLHGESPAACLPAFQTKHTLSQLSVLRWAKVS